MSKQLITYIGIDPGANGSLVALNSLRDIKLLVKPKLDEEVFKWLLGVTTDGIQGGPIVEGRPIDIRDLPSILTPIASNSPNCIPFKNIAAIEEIKPTYGPGTGKGEMAKLYGSYRALCMALTCLEIPFERVDSQRVWRAFGIYSRKWGEDTSAWKKRHRDTAQRLFSGIKVTLATCDALLIAEYLRRKHTKTLVEPMTKPERGTL